MTRKEKVYEQLRNAAGNEGITAGALSEQLGITRANCSAELNRLCQEGRAKKFGGRPVYYRAVDVQRTIPTSTAHDDNLQSFEALNPSLSNGISLAQAAVLYPPRGMDMLLLGETGVGKSMFAGQIHRFAVAYLQREEDVPFISFNCADYAANPQLLLSQLFGVQKGAYTGAEHDKMGLMEQANGGILFLDEIHRLPPEGQEMLFTYLDRGCFRRLGESNAERRATVLLICATTEQPDSALLQSFLRRLPVTISIPNLADRSFAEREQLIFTFFSEQAQQLGQPLRLSLNSLRALIGYNCVGNVGQMRSDIKLLCAKSYAQFIRGTPNAQSFLESSHRWDVQKSAHPSRICHASLPVYAYPYVVNCPH